MSRSIAGLVVMVLMGILLVGCSLVQDPRAEPGRGGPGSVADIAAFLVDGSTEADLMEVSDLLSEPFINSQGQEAGVGFVNGVLEVDWDYVDYALYVRVSPGTSEERISEIMQLLSENPMVDRVERDYLVPLDVPGG